ncbi:polysaccharide deacetylase family protein [Psychrobacillus sp.]|uniref:polysaccharide deacetylase family protein n=1 Tax=Psychrobacillus sp. TaxID=1871623 RepID=UPI0028BF0E54|nr:polysaccharide deacetylase family protein [Psychrobacillus sp.]
MSTHTKPPKRGRWIDIAFITAIISLSSLVAILLFFSTSNKSDKEIGTASPPDKTKEEVNESESVYPGIRIVTETSNDEYSPFAIQYPQSNVPSFNEKVKTYTQQLKTLYLEETKYIRETSKYNKGELNISFEVFPHPTGYYSFVIHSNMYTGGANGVAETNIIRLQSQSGHMLTMKDLLGNSEEALALLSSKLKEAITSDEQVTPYLVEEQMEEKIAPKWDNFTNFALAEDSLKFYFDDYEITAGAAGAPVISIPLSQVNDILADEFQLPVVSIDRPSAETEKPSTDEQKVEEPTTPVTGKIVALTFDDGPNPETTRKVLDTLKKYNAKATFFMLGSRVSFYPELVKEMKDAGHELGNHTWNHPDLTKAPAKKIVDEINNTSNAIEKASGSKPTVFRPPYGAVNKTVRSQTNLPVILWDVDTLDWKHRSAPRLLEIVKEHVRDGSTILMHDIHPSTADGLDAVLAYLQSEGYSFVTVSELP